VFSKAGADRSVERASSSWGRVSAGAQIPEAMANLVVHNTANDVPRSVFSSTIDHSMIKTVEFPRTVIETKFLTGDVAFHRRPFSTNRTHWLYVIEKSARAKLGSRKKDFENNGHRGAKDVYTVLAVTSALALTTVDGRQANDTKRFQGVSI
jgi:hypothetical protein